MLGRSQLFISIGIVVLLLACSSPDSTGPRYKTENLIVFFVDGVRFEESWGDPLKRNVPELANELAAKGIVGTNFRNEGITYTIPGHSASMTGVYESLLNNGSQFSEHPSFMHLYRQYYNAPADKLWVVSSKSKLASLASTNNAFYNSSFSPRADCGMVDATGNQVTRSDSMTMVRVKEILDQERPRILYVSLGGPDISAHASDYFQYLDAIKRSDVYLKDMIDYIESDSLYAGTTTLFMSNDHGRHSDNVHGGYAGHGCSCKGCRHLNFYAYGPDFKQGVESNRMHDLRDIAATSAELLRLNLSASDGESMEELFQ